MSAVLTVEDERVQSVYEHTTRPRVLAAVQAAH
jgi:hypothetical protein